MSAEISKRTRGNSTRSDSKSHTRLDKINDRTILDTRTLVESSSGVDNTGSMVVWTGTWNVGAVNEPFDIEKMVHMEETAPKIDMYAIALQEVTDPGIASVTTGISTKTVRWYQALKHYFELRHLKTLMFESIGGTVLAVYVTQSYFEHITEISIATVPLGRLGLKNKGAVGVRFVMGKTPFCIVCAHLAAGENGSPDYRARIDGYHLITQNLKFKNPYIPALKNAPTFSMLDHENIIFMGDLNFRIIPNEDLDTLKRSDDTSSDQSPLDTAQSLLERLRPYDELLHAMTYDGILTDFHEGVLSFKPTYKYYNREDRYNKQTTRMPAWTDRVLWKSPYRVDLLDYNTKHTIGSDHKPLHALLAFHPTL